MDWYKPLVKWSAKGITIIFLIAGIVMTGLGVYFAFFRTNGFETTTAIVVATEENDTVSTDDTITYFPIVEYTVNGTKYTVKLSDVYVDKGDTGKEIKIKYNPENPKDIHDASPGATIYLLVAGGIITVVSLFVLIKNKKQVQKYAESTGSMPLFGALTRSDAERKLYFVTDLGTAKGTCHIEDESRRVLYELVSKKFSLVADSEVEFVDHVTGQRTTHYIGKVATTSSGAIWVLDNHSTFTVDGKDVWKLLHENGVKIETGIGGIKFNYKISYNGETIATAEACGRYVHEEDEEKHGLLAKTPAPGFYRIRTTVEKCDIIFLTLMAIGRTEMMIYK